MSEFTSIKGTLIYRRADRCPQCGQQVDVISPNWLTFHFDFNNNQADWEVEDHPPDMCLSCTLAVLSDDAREAWEPTETMLRQTLKDIYLPPGFTLYHHRTQNTHIFRRTNGVYQVDWFFIVLYRNPDTNWKIPWIYLDLRDPLMPFYMLIPRVTVSLDAVEAKVIATWNTKNFLDRRVRLEIVDWENATQNDLRRLMEVGVSFARRTPRGRSRRPSYSKDHYINLYLRYYANHGRPKSMPAFCEAANIANDTLRDNLRRWGVTWSEFRDEAEKL